MNETREAIGVLARCGVIDADPDKMDAVFVAYLMSPEACPPAVSEQYEEIADDVEQLMQGQLLDGEDTE